MNSVDAAKWVINKARAVGFDLCGIAPVEDFEELDHLPEWLARGYAGEMKYLHNPRRLDPAGTLVGARSIVVVALNYNTSYARSTASDNADGTRGWISRYAWGDDYHFTLGDKLEVLAAAIREHFPAPCSARAYVDTGPILERIAAKYAGLGWLAKNTCLINQKLGSWLFLGVIVTDLDLEPSITADQLPPADLCGTCRRCIDACPTDAIVEPYVLDARRCIAYLTIELHDAIPEEFRPAIGNMVFGCDICQDVCPWNRKAPVSQLGAFQPRSAGREAAEHAESATEKEWSLFAPSLEWLSSLTEGEFREVFRRSAVKRTKWRGLMRNVCIALGNSNTRKGSQEHLRVTAILERLASSEDALIAEHAHWALARIQQKN